MEYILTLLFMVVGSIGIIIAALALVILIVKFEETFPIIAKAISVIFQSIGVVLLLIFFTLMYFKVHDYLWG